MSISDRMSAQPALSWDQLSCNCCDQIGCNCYNQLCCTQSVTTISVVLVIKSFVIPDLHKKIDENKILKTELSNKIFN